jgi:hypothetical protein
MKAYEAKSLSDKETISILSKRLQEMRDKIKELRETEAYIEAKIALFYTIRQKARIVWSAYG